MEFPNATSELPGGGYGQKGDVLTRIESLFLVCCAYHIVINSIVRKQCNVLSHDRGDLWEEILVGIIYFYNVRQFLF